MWTTDEMLGLVHEAGLEEWWGVAGEQLLGVLWQGGGVRRGRGLLELAVQAKGQGGVRESRVAAGRGARPGRGGAVADSAGLEKGGGRFGFEDSYSGTRVGDALRVAAATVRRGEIVPGGGGLRMRRLERED